MADGATVGRDTAERVYQQIRQAILSHELPAGVPMSQVQLAQRFGVSRTPLREALRKLQQEGLVEGEPNRRVSVAGFSISDLDHLYAMRIALESLAIRLTVPQFTNGDLAHLESAWDRMAAASVERDYPRWATVHREFHMRFVAHAGARLVTTIEQLSDHAERYRHVYFQHNSWDEGIAVHQALLEAARARDAAAAAERVVRHYATTALTLVAMLEPTYEPVAVRQAVRQFA